jgi:hypothetical protein
MERAAGALGGVAADTLGAVDAVRAASDEALLTLDGITAAAVENVREFGATKSGSRSSDARAKARPADSAI